jgi:hypothetical protein
VVIAVTNDELRTTAAKSEHGGFGAAQRVSVTKIGNEVQVAYTNPAYMANAYRMAGDLKDTAAKLQAALGKVEEYGAKGLTAEKLRKYHYTFGMEYFDEPNELAKYASHEEAVKAVEAGLAAGKQGVTKVYRVDVAGKKETLFGVAMKGEGEAGKFMDDKYIMSEIDFKDVKSTAHLPYDILVSDNKVYALVRPLPHRHQLSRPVDDGRQQLHEHHEVARGDPRGAGADRRRLLLRHDGGRGALDEALVGELGLRLGDLAVDARDFLAQALAFGGDVDLDLQHQAEVADDLHRRVAGRQFGAGGRHVRQPGQGGEVGREGGDAFPVAGGEQRHLLRRREVHFAAQAAAGVDRSFSVALRPSAFSSTRDRSAAG